MTEHTDSNDQNRLDQNIQPEDEGKEMSGSAEIGERIVIFPEHVPDRFKKDKKSQKLVMTFPNLIIRELICFQIVAILVIVISLFFDAPLENIANPANTPNPAKAPWYFLGIQELLHNFPPVVAGIVIPVFVILALLAIPYVNINIHREGLWSTNRKKKLFILSSVVFIGTGLCFLFKAFSIIIPSLLLFSISLIPYFFRREEGWINWLSHRCLAEWIMTWFVIVVTILTIIGTFFRGPGWTWVWPW